MDGYVQQLQRIAKKFVEIALRLSIILGLTLPASAEPEFGLYTFAYNQWDRSTNRASFRLAVSKELACGYQPFFRDYYRKSDKTTESNDGQLARVLARVIYYQDAILKGATDTDVACSFPRKTDDPGEFGATTYIAKVGDVEVSLPDNPVELFGEDCRRANTMDQAGVTYEEITFGCLRAQVNMLFMRMNPTPTVGTTGLPCANGGNFLDIRNSAGEWNVSIRAILPSFLIAARARTSILDPETSERIVGRLLTLRSNVGQEGYSIFDCGNDEYVTGSPQDRLDEQSFWNDFGGTIGDFLEWLLRFTILSAAASTAIGAAGPFLLTLGGPMALAGATGLGAAAVVFGKIPETENHLLMIESSRYLQNQIMLSQVSHAYGNADQLIDDQKGVREWLLKRLSRIAKEDFIEYNARPYQRYSLTSILNLAEFADDETLRLAARNVLDLTFAKAAIGSLGGRRLPPYRRLTETLKCQVVERQTEPLEQCGDNFKEDEKEAHRQRNGLLDLARGADYGMTLLQAEFGGSPFLPAPVPAAGENEPQKRLLSREGLPGLMFVLATEYSPPDAALDWAFGKPKAAMTRIRHSGFEIYSSEAGFLLTAGGIQTPPAYSFEAPGVDANGDVLGVIQVARDKDRGVAVPTTLMLAGGSRSSHLEAFLRIDGRKVEYGNDAGFSFEGNLCVSGGFACGENLRVPVQMAHCFRPDPDHAGSHWRFFDSSECTGLYDDTAVLARLDPTTQSWGPEEGTRVLIAKYEVQCSNQDRCENLGIFEAVTVSNAADANGFRKRIIANHPEATTRNWHVAIGNTIGSEHEGLAGDYVSSNGSTYSFRTFANAEDSDQSGLTRDAAGEVPKLSDWPRARGVLEGEDDGRFTFTNPNGKGFRIDMSDWESPQWSAF